MIARRRGQHDHAAECRRAPAPARNWSATRNSSGAVVVDGDGRWPTLPAARRRSRDRSAPDHRVDPRGSTPAPAQSPAPPRCCAPAPDGQRDLPGDARGLLPGLVIGDTSALHRDLDEAMRATGMTHLTAVSGSNVAVVIGLVFGGCTSSACRGDCDPPRACSPWPVSSCWRAPSRAVLRASAMGAIGLIGISRHRRSIGRASFWAAPS